MARAKIRIEVPSEVAAGALFASDRICCVCRERGKPVQIHHIDEDPSNNGVENLAVLCFDCHHHTQLRGGFDRKLEAEQVRTYRDDWLSRVTKRRDTADALASSKGLTENVGSLTAELPPFQIEARGSSRHPDNRWTSRELLAYVCSLPAVLREARGRAQPRWDSGVTAEMNQASYDVVDVLEQILVHLESWYPEDHFGGKSAADYFNELIASRFTWHRAHLEPDGAGSGGTIVGTQTGASVMSDLESMVEDMVCSLMGMHDDFSFKGWKLEWRGQR